MPGSPKNPEGCIHLALALSAAVLGAAIAFQYLGGFEPCRLCLAQRYPYVMGLAVLGVDAVILRRRTRWGWARSPILSVAVVGFAAGAALGIYHAGAEWDLWRGPTDCGMAALDLSSAESFLASIEATKAVSCTEAPWRFLGLSFAGWNVIASMAIAGLCALSMRKGRDRVGDAPASASRCGSDQLDRYFRS